MRSRAPARAARLSRLAPRWFLRWRVMQLTRLVGLWGWEGFLLCCSSSSRMLTLLDLSGFLSSAKPELVAQRFPVRFDPVGLEGGAQSDSDSSSVIDFKPRRSIRDLDLNLPPPVDA
ncbi:hypothetical protein OIU84_029172 [Salix udensis]|uniref:Uncharacterized protein n=1 Tax=Salix udensis TaxID=889485 RepID=A0AAD6K982_9ROSI|nr:hypothetical protein OIU84_029172 [Salix udensis]